MPWPDGSTVVGLTTIHDEKGTIARAIESFQPLCDSIVALDVGSTDGAVDIARDMGVEVYGHEWDGFNSANMKLLELAGERGDYGLFFGAIETVEQTDELPDLDAPLYVLPFIHQDVMVSSERLFDTSIEWHQDGPVHSNIQPFFFDERGMLDQLTITSHDDDGRRRGKLLRYRDELELWLAENPHDHRSTYYLANTYYHLGNAHTACGLFLRRAQMTEGDLEAWHSLYMAGVCEMRFDFPTGARRLLDCIAMRPDRMEPAYTLEHALHEVRSKTPLPDKRDLMDKGELLWLFEDAYLGGD